MPLLLLHAITFLAAFLLFQIELIVAKMLLPVYGGSYFVWGACLVFFQAFLLLGYLFVHLMSQKFGVRVYRKIQLAITFLPFLFFPGHLLKMDGAGMASFIAGDVFWRLLVTIGPVFFVLSTTGVALQMWLSASSLKEKTNPYALYATSNAGSLGALLTYPFLFEIVFDLTQQQQLWRLGYLALAVCNVLLFVKVPVAEAAPESAAPVPAAPKVHKILWFLLSAASVMLFMAVTNIMTYSIAPMPLLWVIPLSIYLLAFILSFKAKPWCPAWITDNIFFFLVGGSLLFFILQKKNFAAVELELLIFCLTLFFVCLYCQNQLVRHKPTSDRELTFFYLMISLGGFVGGVVTSWGMPLLSKSVIEYLLALTMIVFGVWMVAEEKASVTPPSLSDRLRNGSLVAVPILLCFFWVPELSGHNPALVLYKKRNYYGIYEVREFNGIRTLAHGTTMHGAQIRLPGLELEPTSFFSRTSALGEILGSSKFSFRNIGVIGLGVGAMANYTQPGQSMDIYELDPEMYNIAQDYFTYLKHAKGKIDIIYGDARRSLRERPDNKYDLFIVDAFGGDSIPFHLLTREAIAEYRKHLKPDGILLCHISNRFVRLEPVLVGVAEASGAQIGYRMTSGRPYGIPSAWAILTWNEAQFRDLVQNQQWLPIASLTKERYRVWTDDYSNIFPVLDLEKIKRSLLNFKLSSDL